MVAAGVGCTLLPALAAAPPSSSAALIAIRPFVEPVPFRTIGLVYRRGFPRLEMIHALVELLRQQVPASVAVI
jgi:LysR family hydrogen peroxide-inducible transcriptional activator